ncbi:hypothetical protein ACFL35_06480 [Candidatus Riflebacteria bacterium]
MTILKKRALQAFVLFLLPFIISGCGYRTVINHTPPVWKNDQKTVIYAKNEVSVPNFDMFTGDRWPRADIVAYDSETKTNKSIYHEFNRRFIDLQTTKDGSIYFVSDEKKYEGIKKREFKRLSPEGLISTIGSSNCRISADGERMVTHDPSKLPHSLKLLDKNGQLIEDIGSPIPNQPYMDVAEVKWSADSNKIYLPTPYLQGEGGAPPFPRPDPDGKIWEYDFTLKKWSETAMSFEDYTNYESPTMSATNDRGERAYWKDSKGDGEIISQLTIEQTENKVTSESSSSTEENSLLQKAFTEMKDAESEYAEGTKNKFNSDIIESLYRRFMEKRLKYETILKEKQ